MAAAAHASAALAQEARSLLTRLDRVKSFALQETMVPAAAPAFATQSAIETYLSAGRRELRGEVQRYLDWLAGDEGRRASPAEAQRRYVLLRLRFNIVLSQFDIFSEAMSQRSEAETGVWLSGLDVVSRDALALPGYLEAPPVLCYLARGPGAAIRRARTRLPGGGENPVAVIRIPRERMIGSGIASSLVHEVGHQGAALLDLLPSLRAALMAAPRGAGAAATAWDLWVRWISEIVADLWSVGRLGVTSTAGLIGVVSLPRAFVFRTNDDDPHPMPWMRVQLSGAIGHALYPDPQWARLTALWESFYPLDGLDAGRRELIAALQAGMLRFVERLLAHRPRSLAGRTLGEALSSPSRRHAELSASWGRYRGSEEALRAAPPTLAFAAIGQARVDGALSPEDEARLLAELLRAWALDDSLDASAQCASRPQPQRAPTIRAAYARAV